MDTHATTTIQQRLSEPGDPPVAAEELEERAFLAEVSRIARKASAREIDRLLQADE